MVGNGDNVRRKPQSTAVGEDEQLQARLLFMQMEALGIQRREHITTAEFREKAAGYIPSAYINRRVDESGTKENRAAQGESRAKLKAWNTAWEDLHDDGTVTQDLKDINEGLGQTHRGKLQADDSLKDYNGEDYSYRGGYRYGRGGRGGREAQGGGRDGFGGRTTSRNAATVRAAPVKRTRVVKGSTSPGTTTGNATSKRKEAWSPRAVTKALIRQPVVKLEEISGNMSLPQGMPPEQQATKLKTLSGSKPASLNKSLPQPPTVARESMGPKPVKIDFAIAKLADPKDIMTSILKTRTHTTASNTTTQPKAAKEIQVAAPTPGPEAVNDFQRAVLFPDAPKDLMDEYADHTSTQSAVLAQNAAKDLMDLDVGQEAPRQPVIGFTHSYASLKQPDYIPPLSSTFRMNDPQQSSASADEPPIMAHFRALQAGGALNEDQLAIIQGIADQLKAQDIAPPEKAAVPTEVAVPTEAAPPIEPVNTKKYNPSTLLALRPEAASLPKVVVTPTPHAEKSRVMAQKLQQERNLIIGSHVHRSRFQRALLIEKFQKLKISEDSTSRLARTLELPVLPSTSGRPTEAKADSIGKSNSFGSARFRPAKPTQSKRSRPAGPSLPAHLEALPPVTDPGAAARAQYGSPGVKAPGRGILDPVSNGQLRSLAQTEVAAATPQTAPAPRTSMLNRTGFIGQAENRAQAKKGGDPLIVARNRDM